MLYIYIYIYTHVLYIDIHNDFKQKKHIELAKILQTCILTPR